MSEVNQNLPSLSANSSGQSLTDADTLDSHYRLSKPEYDACIASVNIQPGWHVLDAGCGNGVFIPHITTAVGPEGHVTAVDHAPENIQAVQALLERAAQPAPVTTHIADLTKLPFEDSTFDCVWCANVTQYLTEAELDAAVAEFKRVVKPNGIVAIKEVDVAGWHIYPVEASLLWRLFDAGVRAQDTQTIGALRGWAISKWLRRHSLEITVRKSTLVERVAPLADYAISYIGGLLKWLGAIAQTLDLTEQDKAAWRDIQGNVESLLSEPDALLREIIVLTVGKVVK